MRHGDKDYGMVFPMSAIRDIWKELNIRTASEAAIYLHQIYPQDGEPNMVATMELAAICSYHGIRVWCEQQGIECPFSSSEDLQNHVTKFEQISPAIAPYAKAIEGFFLPAAPDKKKQQKGNQ